MRRLAAALIALFALGLASSTAHAQRARERAEAQPTWGIDFGVGPYRPQAGNDLERSYFKLIFVQPDDKSYFSRHPLLAQLSVNWYLLRDFGLLGVTFQGGFWSMEGRTRLCTDASGKPTGCTPETVFTSELGTDTTTLSVFPLSVGVIYKIDQLKRAFSVPLVPYLRGSFDWLLWRNTVRGKVTHSSQGRGSGGNFGLHGGAGIALNLDWIEPSGAASARANTGLADTYLYGEASYYWADYFGNAKRLDLSDWVFQVGLSLDFL